MGRLDGQTALVTGAASGIGRAAATLFAREGARVWLADVDEAGGREAAREIKGEFVHLDVSRAQAWDEALAELPSLHLAFLNAGVTTHPPSAGGGIHEVDFAALDEQRYRRILGVNVDGVVFGIRAVLPRLEASGGGAIVVTASVAGLLPFPPDPIYTLTKHAVVGLTRALAPALAPRNVTLDAVCPGGVDTRILGPGMGERARAAGMALLDPAEVAQVALDAALSPGTGRCWVCVKGSPAAPHRFAPVRGLEG